MCPPVEEAPTNSKNSHANVATQTAIRTKASHRFAAATTHIRTTGPHTSLWATFYTMFLGSKLSNQHYEKESNLQTGLEGTALFMSK